MMTVNEKTDIKSLLPDELRVMLAESGQPAYRARQLFSWLASGCGDWGEMTNLPASLRKQLSERCHLYAPEAMKKLVSAEDGTA